jgi:hypothetical protein
MSRHTVSDPAAPAHPGTERFEFACEGAVGRAAELLGLAAHAYVEVDDTTFTARFGPWMVRTPLSNISGVSVTGPYAPWKVIGPPRLSFADRGLTFATTARQGLCIRFFEPVVGIEPTGRLHHPGLTVTVADPVRVMAAIAS